MIETYSESVLDAADNDGNLSYPDAQRLFKAHGLTLEAIYENPQGVCPVALDARNAEALLAWLGY